MLTALGLVLTAGGLGLAVRAGLLLAGRGRPRRGPQPRFVLAGPYLRVRNPLLAGLVVALGGAVLAARDVRLAALPALAGLAAHLWVVRVEEPRLRARFGAAYAAYLVAVPRWLPAARARARGES